MQFLPSSHEVFFVDSFLPAGPLINVLRDVFLSAEQIAAGSSLYEN
jgi:hypothetical protein